MIRRSEYDDAVVDKKQSFPKIDLLQSLKTAKRKDPAACLIQVVGQKNKMDLRVSRNAVLFRPMGSSGKWTRYMSDRTLRELVRAFDKGEVLNLPDVLEVTFCAPKGSDTKAALLKADEKRKGQVRSPVQRPREAQPTQEQPVAEVQPIQKQPSQGQPVVQEQPAIQEQEQTPESVETLVHDIQELSVRRAWSPRQTLEEYRHGFGA